MFIGTHFKHTKEWNLKLDEVRSIYFPFFAVIHPASVSFGMKLNWYFQLFFWIFGCNLHALITHSVKIVCAAMRCIFKILCSSKAPPTARNFYSFLFINFFFFTLKKTFCIRFSSVRSWFQSIHVYSIETFYVDCSDL